jgi:hypothetical protein
MIVCELGFLFFRAEIIVDVLLEALKTSTQNYTSYFYVVVKFGFSPKGKNVVLKIFENEALKRIFVQDRKQQEDGRNYIIRSFKISTFHQILLG